MAVLSTRMPRPKGVKSLAEELIAVSNETRVQGRRENLVIPTDRMEALRVAVEKQGQLVLPLSKVVEFLGLSKSYDTPAKAYLFASSLSRRLGDIRVGAREHGRILHFRPRSKGDSKP